MVPKTRRIGAVLLATIMLGALSSRSLHWLSLPKENKDTHHRGKVDFTYNGESVPAYGYVIAFQGQLDRAPIPERLPIVNVQCPVTMARLTLE